MALLYQQDDLLTLRSLPLILAFLVLLPVLYATGRATYFAFFHPLSKVPGPKVFGATQLPFLYHLIRGDWTTTLKELHDRYGPVVRIAPNDVSIITADAWKKIYGHKNSENETFEKDLRFYRQNRPAPSIIIANNDDHRRMRRLLAHAFSEKALRNQQGVLDHYITAFIRGIGQRAEQGLEVDLVAWFNFATFDLIGDLSYGQPFGCLEKGEYHPWVLQIFRAVKSTVYGQVITRLGLKRWAGILSPAALRKASEKHNEFALHTSLARIDSGNTTREDFLSYILRHNNDEKGMSRAEISETSSTLILAGSETTATLLSGTTFHLLKNRDKYEKLVKEIRSAFSSQEDITLVKVNQLEYLLATLSESLRMYPPVPVGLPRVTPSSGEYLEGYWIPSKTSVSVPQWSAYRSTRNFRDPDMFVPERWLDDPRYASDVRSVLQPFSYGPRNCIGKNLAYAEMRLILTHLLWKFDLELSPECDNWDQQNIFFFWDKRSLNVKLTEVVREKE